MYAGYLTSGFNVFNFIDGKLIANLNLVSNLI